MARRGDPARNERQAAKKKSNDSSEKVAPPDFSRAVRALNVEGGSNDDQNAHSQSNKPNDRVGSHRGFTI